MSNKYPLANSSFLAAGMCSRATNAATLGWCGTVGCLIVMVGATMTVIPASAAVATTMWREAADPPAEPDKIKRQPVIDLEKLARQPRRRLGDAPSAPTPVAALPEAPPKPVAPQTKAPEAVVPALTPVPMAAAPAPAAEPATGPAPVPTAPIPVRYESRSRVTAADLGPVPSAMVATSWDPPAPRRAAPVAAPVPQETPAAPAPGSVALPATPPTTPAPVPAPKITQLRDRVTTLPVSMMVAAVTGDVQIRTMTEPAGAEAVWSPVLVGQRYLGRYEVKSGSGSPAEFSLDGGGIVRIAEQSRIAIQAKGFASENDGSDTPSTAATGRCVIQLYQGSVVVTPPSTGVLAGPMAVYCGESVVLVRETSNVASENGTAVARPSQSAEVPTK